MLTLSPAQRRALRARAHALQPVVAIGENGLSPSVIQEISTSLDAHELVKIRAAQATRDAREALLARICDQLDAAPVQHIGKILVIYRPLPEGTPPPRRRRASSKVRRTKRQFQGN